MLKRTQQSGRMEKSSFLSPFNWDEHLQFLDYFEHSPCCGRDITEVRYKCSMVWSKQDDRRKMWKLTLSLTERSQMKKKSHQNKIFLYPQNNIFVPFKPPSSKKQYKIQKICKVIARNQMEKKIKTIWQIKNFQKFEHGQCSLLCNSKIIVLCDRRSL